jgi:hypothetical protein
MKFTLSWLKEHLDTDEPLEKLADKLTMIGLEVENIEDKAKALSAFSIARVISAEQHPNADRLRVCMVDTGDGGAPVQGVCGAPNARTGMISVFSPRCSRFWSPKSMVAVPRADFPMAGKKSSPMWGASCRALSFARNHLGRSSNLNCPLTRSKRAAR